MKKNIMLLSLVTLLTLCGCQGNSNSKSNNPSSNSSSSKPVSSSTTSSTTSSSSSTSSSSVATGPVYSEDTDLLITEYVEGSKTDKCIEIYNFTETEVDLSEYSLSQYRSDYVPTVTIPLSGKLAPKTTYVVAYSSASDALLEKADYDHLGLTFTGKNAITLNHHGKIVDILGYIGFAIDYAKDMTLVRKVDRMEPRTQYDEYDWIRYGVDNFKYLGNVENSVTPEELLAGPYLEDQYLNLEDYPFFAGSASSKVGGGGAVPVTIKNNIDGDTTDLYITNNVINPSEFMTSTSYYGTIAGKRWVRIRYQAVDTPESYSGNIQEFGKLAAAYTAFVQNQADEMFLQSVKGGSLLCNYGRVMGYVWAGRNRLMNYETIKHGYSTVSYEFYNQLTSRDIPYESYFYNASLYARMNKLGLYGEEDPYWNYQSNTSYCESKTCLNVFEAGKPF